MDTQKYDIHKWKKIMDTTQSNYANMINRLTRKSKISDFVLIYYSIFAIMCSLTSKFFPNYFNADLAEYFNIMLAVIMLAYSLINSNADYSTRISNIENSLNELKTLKRQMDNDNLNETVIKYNTLADKTERRDDQDFFITVKHLSKEYGINWITNKEKRGTSRQEHEIANMNEEEDKERKEQIKAVNNYLSELNPWAEQFKILIEWAWAALLFLIPIIIFILCLVIRF